MKKLMRKCFILAKKGEGKTSPNPIVGCIILDKNGNIISTGYHKKYGENHAERDALLKLKNGEETGGTLIVNLEPCNHYGKTPPCTDLIIERKIKKVIISSKDTNPKAMGGIKKLREAGIEVIEGVLEEEGKQLNEVFYTNINKKRTFIALKTASTIDGKIATKNGNSKWITSNKARKYAKILRQKYDAILTSSSTVINDNPEMKHKIKIIIDREHKTNFNYNIFKQGKCYLATKKTIIKNLPSNVEIIKYTNLRELLKELYLRGIMSIFVEAGGKLLGSFLKEGLCDKIYHFVAPKILNDNNGRSAFDGDSITEISNTKNLVLVNSKKLDPDILLTYELQQS